VVIKADHAAFFSASISPNQYASRFQLALFWSTISKLLILKTGHEPVKIPFRANNSI
jgi:hypothetical protein